MTSKGKKKAISDEYREWLKTNIKLAQNRIITIRRYSERHTKTEYLNIYVLENGRPHRITEEVAALIGYSYSEKAQMLEVPMEKAHYAAGLTIATMLSEVLYGSPSKVFTDDL
jgi:hypothetical protein